MARLTEHTPGPWTYLDLGEVVTDDNFEVTIATIDYSSERAEADGNLIAAAPELLEVAMRILDRGYVSEHIGEERDDHLALASAIAKATRSTLKQEDAT